MSAARGEARRVVITGLGVLAPNGNGVGDFELALRKGRSGLRRNEDMEEAGFGCRVAGVPQGVDALAESYFDEDLLLVSDFGWVRIRQALDGIVQSCSGRDWHECSRGQLELRGQIILAGLSNASSTQAILRTLAAPRIACATLRGIDASPSRCKHALDSSSTISSALLTCVRRAGTRSIPTEST